MPDLLLYILCRLIQALTLIGAAYFFCRQIRRAIKGEPL